MVVSFAHVIQAGWTNGSIGNVKARYRENIDSRSTNLDPSSVGFDQLSNDETSDIWCSIRFRQIAFHNPPIAWTPQCFIDGERQFSYSRSRSGRSRSGRSRSGRSRSGRSRSRRSGRCRS